MIGCMYFEGAWRSPVGWGLSFWWRHWLWWRHRITTRRWRMKRKWMSWGSEWSYRTTNDDCSRDTNCFRPSGTPSGRTATSPAPWYPVTGSWCSRRTPAAAVLWRLWLPSSCTTSRRLSHCHLDCCHNDSLRRRRTRRRGRRTKTRTRTITRRTGTRTRTRISNSIMRLALGAA